MQMRFQSRQSNGAEVRPPGIHAVQIEVQLALTRLSVVAGQIRLFQAVKTSIASLVTCPVNFGPIGA